MREGPRNLLRGLARINGGLAVGLFACLTVVVALQVFTRFILHAPFIWSEELARFLFFWVVLLGSSLSVKQRRHFVIDVFMASSSGPRRRWNRVVDLIPDLCILGFSVLLLVQGIGYTRVGLLRVAPNSQVNMALVYLAVPVFAALSILYSAGNLASDLSGLLRGGSSSEDGILGVDAGDGAVGAGEDPRSKGNNAGGDPEPGNLPNRERP
jgi:TRAP-type C4-dicarboxylate transport system permease small subunit